MHETVTRSTPVPVILMVLILAGIFAACLVVFGLGIFGEITRPPVSF